MACEWVNTFLHKSVLLLPSPPHGIVVLSQIHGFISYVRELVAFYCCIPFSIVFFLNGPGSDPGQMLPVAIVRMILFFFLSLVRRWPVVSKLGFGRDSWLLWVQFRKKTQEWKGHIIEFGWSRCCFSSANANPSQRICLYSQRMASVPPCSKRYKVMVMHIWRVLGLAPWGLADHPGKYSA